MRPFLFATLVAGLALAASPALAQRPHTPPGLLKNNGRGPGSSAGPPSNPDPGGPSAPRVRSIGAWLDDATAMSPGEAWLTVSVQRWSSPIGSGFEAPVMDVIAGIAPGAHLFLSVPYSRTTYTGLPSYDEMGTIYAGGKLVIRDVEQGGLGFAATPAVEILSSSALDGTGYSRFNLLLPVSLEWRGSGTRIYGTSGYFTRGAVFASGALERALSDRVIGTIALSQGWATGDTALSEALGLRRSRTDLSGSVAWVASPYLMFYGGLARTISPLDADAMRYAVSFGASMNLRTPGRRVPVKKP